MKVFFGADHRGLSLKNELVEFTKDLSFSVEDLGASSLDPNDDYPTFAHIVCENVVKDKTNRGVLLCGSGAGVDIAANKFDGIRASIGINKDQVAAGRRDDDMNVLVIAADYTNISDAIEMVRIFLKTDYEKTEKHDRRLKKIASFEKKF